VLPDGRHRLEGGQVRRTPLVRGQRTTTTRRPDARTVATSPASFSMAPTATRPDPEVTEDEPIFTTTVPAGSVFEPEVTAFMTGAGGLSSPR
jgi:hypothetical protein